MTVHIGTSGWHYEDWRDTFYPEGLPRKQWLTFYADRFATVESNAAFYRLPKRETFEGWAGQAPRDFKMAVKMSRYLTHVKRLAEPEEPVSRFLGRAEGLGDKLGPVLLQLPPTLSKDLERLDEVLALLAHQVRVAVEFREGSWFDDETRSCLETHGAALCLTDRGSKPSSPLWVTADWTYLRFHFGTGKPDGCYGRSSIASWAKRLIDVWGSDAEMWAFFNNDMHACAPRDARRFALACRSVGLDATRAPDRGEVTVAGT